MLDHFVLAQFALFKASRALHYLSDAFASVDLRDGLQGRGGAVVRLLLRKSGLSRPGHHSTRLGRAWNQLRVYLLAPSPGCRALTSAAMFP